MKNKAEIYFDKAAETWDQTNKADPTILERIADIAGIAGHSTVLDAGCGTGVMFPLYLRRGVKKLTAVDISEKMLDCAKRKYPKEEIEFVHCDITDFSPERTFDCVMVHNAFPHFLRQREAVERLKALTSPGGTLTIAHSISREAVLNCHRHIPEISEELPTVGVLTEMLGSCFEDVTAVSDGSCFIVSAKKKKDEFSGE